jgi:aspartate ammonia-lyase
MEPAATDAVKTGMTMASCLGHLRNNRIEYLIVTLLMYSIGALDKAIEYGTGICV